MFEISLDVDKPNDASKIIRNRRVEGVRLTQMIPNNKNISDREAFLAYFLMFTKHYHSNPTMDPFVKQTHGPNWMTRKFHATGEHEVESKKICEVFLTPKLLSTRLGTSK